MNRIFMRSLIVLLVATALISIGAHQAIAANRMQNAISEAKSLAASCRSADSCSDCVEKNVIPAIIRKYRIESRREISEVSTAARASCN